MRVVTVNEQQSEYDVVIIGAGISGIGAAHYLRTEHPQRTFTILEGRDTFGGTWDLFRYPGIRSDSDLNTMGFEFKPWRDKDAIASGDKILTYLKEAIAEDNLGDKIQYRHKVVGAAWSSLAAKWTLDVETTDANGGVSHKQLRANWIYLGTGYYDYDNPYLPEFKGRDDFKGTVVHPQHWPENLDYKGKKVVVIGSGATAVTLIPSMLEGPGAAAHITMLQRTPTYIATVPKQDKIAIALRKLFGDDRAYKMVRNRNIKRQHRIYTMAMKHPEFVKKAIRKGQAKELPADFDFDKHLNPPYNPWTQRLCAVPDGDLFKAISAGKADIVTDTIETFTPTGIRLTSGQELEADVIVTATGLNLKFLGGMQLTVDGKPVVLKDVVQFRGCMYSTVPNVVAAFGYTNASWTLKIGILSQYWSKLMTYMDQHGYDAVVPVAPEGMTLTPSLDFGSGYVQRKADELSRQGDHGAWISSTGYLSDRKLLKEGHFPEPGLEFSVARSRILSHA